MYGGGTALASSHDGSACDWLQTLMLTCLDILDLCRYTQSSILSSEKKEEEKSPRASISNRISLVSWRYPRILRISSLVESMNETAASIREISAAAHTQQGSLHVCDGTCDIWVHGGPSLATSISGSHMRR